MSTQEDQCGEVISNQHRWIDKAARVCLPMAMVLSLSRISWSDREVYSAAIMETFREARLMDDESERHRQSRCDGQAKPGA